jgi:hypothetical protein
MEADVSVVEQRKKDWSIMRKMMEHIWPPDWSVRTRVLLGLGLLVGGKVSLLQSIPERLLTYPTVVERSSSSVVQGGGGRVECGRYCRKYCLGRRRVADLGL